MPMVRNPVLCYDKQCHAVGVLTIAMEQYTKAVFATETRNRLPSFQLMLLE